jgi:uncharacterized protein (TIGR02246 family)
MNTLLRFGAAAALVMSYAQPAHAQAPASDDAAVRGFIAEWNSAYRAMDAKRLASLFADDVEIIDRFGHWVRPGTRDDLEKLWHLTFTQIYKGKPGPERKVESVRVLAPDVAVVQATTHWEAVTLDDGTVIPPHGEIDTFLLVKKADAWRVVLLNIHNQMAPGTERPGERVPKNP